MPYGQQAPQFSPFGSSTPPVPAASMAAGMEAARPQAPQGGGWDKFYTDVFKSPEALTFMLALGNSLAQRRAPGQGPMSQLTNGVMQGFGMMGLMAQLRQQREQQGQETKLKERQVANEEQRTKVAGEQATAEAGYNKQRLDIEGQRLTGEQASQASTQKLELARLGIEGKQLDATMKNNERLLEAAKAQAQTDADKNRIAAAGQLNDVIKAQLAGIENIDDPKVRAQMIQDATDKAQSIVEMMGVKTGRVDTAAAAAAGNPEARAELAVQGERSKQTMKGAIAAPEGGRVAAPAGGSAPSPTTPAIPTPPVAGLPPEQALRVADMPTATPTDVSNALAALTQHLAVNPSDAQAVTALSKLRLRQAGLSLGLTGMQNAPPASLYTPSQGD